MMKFLEKFCNDNNCDKFWYGAIFVSVVVAAIMVVRIDQMSMEADARLAEISRANENRIVALETEVSLLKEIVYNNHTTKSDGK